MTPQLQNVAVWNGRLDVVVSATTDQRYRTSIKVGDKDLDFYVLVPLDVWRKFETSGNGTSQGWRDSLLESLTQYAQGKLEGGEWKPCEENREFRVSGELTPD
jgi:hypothetical protein